MIFGVSCNVLTPKVQIDDIKFRPPIFKVKNIIFIFLNISDFPLEKHVFSFYIQCKLENRGSKLNVIHRYTIGAGPLPKMYSTKEEVEAV